MKDFFDLAVEIVLSQEGGLVDNPSDPGGITFRGVSLMAIVGLKDSTGHLEFDIDGDGDVDADDVRALAKVWAAGDHSKIVEFYRQRYWLATKANELRWPYCLCLFDAAVNHGPKAGITLLQKAFGVHADGIMGPDTIRAVNAKPVRDNLQLYCAKRARLYYDISVARGPIFFDGWMRRLFDIHAECLRRA